MVVVVEEFSEEKSLVGQSIDVSDERTWKGSKRIDANLTNQECVLRAAWSLQGSSTWGAADLCYG